MLIRQWRNDKGLSLADAAAMLGLKSPGSLSEIERGLVMPEPSTMTQIEAATLGQVTVADHLDAWVKAHRDQYLAARKAGRSAARAWEKSAARSKETDGQKTSGRTQRKGKASHKSSKRRR